MTKQLLRQPTTADDPRLDAWRTFLRAHATVMRRLEAELGSEQDLALTDYDVLYQLVTAPEHRLRMSELADALLLSRSGVTRLVDRLVNVGLVERVTCDTDRRGQWASLTDAGLARLREATPTHLRGVSEHFLDRISADDLSALERMLEPIAEA